MRDNLSDLEDKLDQFSSDEVSLVNVMLESRQVYEKQTAEPKAKANAELSVKGRLKENIDFWREIGTSNWVFKVSEQPCHLWNYLNQLFLKITP